MDVVTGFREDELKGIKVQRLDGRILKTAVNPIECEFLANEARMLERMNGRYAPEIFRSDGLHHYGIPIEKNIIIEDLGISQTVTDETKFRRECCRLLLRLREVGIRHGDLTSKNIIVRDNTPYAIDFHQSKDWNDPTPDKRPEGDTYHLWQAAEALSPDTSRHIRKWRAIRPYLLPGTILDAGCAEGDYLLMASAERTDVREFIGIDSNWNALNAVSVGGAPLLTIHEDLVDYIEMYPERADIAFFLSVYAHIARKYGQQKADNVLSALYEKSERLFFETQLHDDGPGLESHRTDEDVWDWLIVVLPSAKVTKLATIPVHGREPLARTVWMIE